MTPAVFIAAGAAVFVLYTLIGYPLLLALLAQRRERPVERRPVTPTVSVLLAVRNGAPWLEMKLTSLLALDYPAGRIPEILVVSDGSTDATAAIVNRFAAAHPARGIRLLELPKGGKARAINAGLPLLTGETVLFTDARQPLAPDSLRRLAACMADPAVGAVSGELVLRDGETLETVSVGAYWKYEFWMRKNLSRIDSIFGATGAIYLMRRSLTASLPPDILLDDMHQPLGAFFAGYRLVVEPGAIAYDTPAKLGNEFHRKVRTLAGNFQILRAFPALLGPGNRMWLHFVSSKFARLLLPYALIAFAAAAFWLPSPWNNIAVSAQAVFYGLAALDIWIPDGFAGKRLTAPVRTFAVLMAAALCASAILFVPAERLWRPSKA